MARKVTPAQLQSMIRQAQNQQRQAINKLNAEINRVNAHNKQVVEQYNRNAKKAVSDYNREVNAHNARVRANQQRLQSELRKLNSRATTTRYATYSTSVRTLERSFTGVENAPSTNVWAERRGFVDLAESETANSVASLNSLLDAPEVASDDDDPSLRTTALTTELSDINPELGDRWAGALFSLSPKNPDAARHFCTSAREILTTILDTEAPDSAVKATVANYPKTPNGGVSRRAKIMYCMAKNGGNSAEAAEFIDADIDSVITLFDDFNHGTHGGAGRFNLHQLTVIKARVEGAIQFLHRVLR